MSFSQRYYAAQRYCMEVLDGSPDHRLSHYIEWLITGIVLINCTAVVLESIQSLHQDFPTFFHDLEFWSVMFFTVEYAVRVWAYGARHRDTHQNTWKGRRDYIFSPFGLIDFFATMPYYLQAFVPGLDLRILRVLRLLRILKLSKYNTALQDLFHAVHSERQAFGSAVFLLTIATIVSASLMHFAEGHEQPQYFGTIPHSMYWSIVTITSGWGNVDPVTKEGEIIALITGFLGVCMAAIMTGIVASAFSNQVARKKAAFEAQLREIYADGDMSEEEQASLKRLQAHYRLSDEQVEAMLKKAELEAFKNKQK